MKKQLKAILKGTNVITKPFALEILAHGKKHLLEIFSVTQQLREKTFRNRISLCQILNIKSGNCSEDCRFCAQAKHVSRLEENFSLSKEMIFHQLHEKVFSQAEYLGLVASGRSVPFSEIQIVCKVLQKTSAKTKYCTSFGILDQKALKKLKKSGVFRYHHNLETSETFFPKICQTHTWRERFDTLLLAKKVGLSICSGGILGMGESLTDRVDLAFSLKEADVDSIPINFLTPISKTLLSGVAPLSPLDMLLSIAMFRLIHPRAEIRVAAGRKQLGLLEPFLFMAGANGLMIGDLLTIKGSCIEEDMQLLQSLDLLSSN